MRKLLVFINGIYCKTLCPVTLNDQDLFNFVWGLDKGIDALGISIYLLILIYI